MNLKIFDLPDPSGRMYKESFLMKNYKDEYDYIIDYCNSHNLVDISFKEKVYMTLNNLTELPVCKNINCLKKVKFKNSSIGYLEYCSRSCVSKDPNIIKTKEEKSIQKFGTKSPAQSAIVKEKLIKTNQLKYGHNSAMCLLETKQKSKNTLLKNFGVTNPSESEEILTRRIQSFKKSRFKETFKNTSLEKYGVEHPWMNKDIHKKTIDFFYSSYRNRILSKIERNKFDFVDFRRGITTSLIFRCHDCGEDFDILPYQFYYRNNRNISICTKCYPISENSSISQIELFNFISENYQGEIIINCRDIIKPYEIDIYLPSMKIGFEFNGVWWHSGKFKNQNYHLEKYNLSKINDIDLITIWEDDWIIKREICESFILNKLKKTSNKIYARNCKIEEIPYNQSREFLNNNHFQGDCKSSVRIGLMFNDELVSLMVFSKLRLPLQKNKHNRSNVGHYELLRFCNKINTSVIGGASKILRHFINNYNPIQIDSYSDNLISDGKLYSTLGFEYSHTSKPGYWYVIDGIRTHRFNWRKQRLVKLGYDSSKTEEEIMSELGHYRIYNAGNKKWILNTNI